MKRAPRLSSLAWIALASAALQAAAAPFPEYRPQQPVEGLVRTWGHGSRTADYVGGLVKDWETGFRRHHPGVRFETTLRGDSTAIGGLYTGAADIALMERAPIAIELDAYQPIFRHDPFEVTVATGSVDVRGHNPALVVFVHRDNPLARLTLAELDAILGADQRRGAQPIRRWGELGLRGAWARQPITVFVPAIASDQSQYLEKAVMGGSQKWTARLREFVPARTEAGQQILDALARDRYAIGVSTLVYRNPRVKPLALAATAGGPYHAATRETVAARTYPLTRTVSMFINRAPGQPVDPAVGAYLRYILSAEGQAAIARDGKYFPLSPDRAQQEWSKLK